MTKHLEINVFKILSFLLFLVKKETEIAEHFSDERVRRGHWFERRLDCIWSIESQMVLLSLIQRS